MRLPKELNLLKKKKRLNQQTKTIRKNNKFYKWMTMMMLELDTRVTKKRVKSSIPRQCLKRKKVYNNHHHCLVIKHKIKISKTCNTSKRKSKDLCKCQTRS